VEEVVLRSQQVGGLVVLGSLDRLDEGDEVRRQLTKARCDDRAAALPVAAKPQRFWTTTRTFLQV
jgi:hypothetical protein